MSVKLKPLPEREPVAYWEMSSKSLNDRIKLSLLKLKEQPLIQSEPGALLENAHKIYPNARIKLSIFNFIEIKETMFLLIK